jgi:hypothetical protein
MEYQGKLAKKKKKERKKEKKPLEWGRVFGSHVFGKCSPSHTGYE